MSFTPLVTYTLGAALQPQIAHDQRTSQGYHNIHLRNQMLYATSLNTCFSDSGSDYSPTCSSYSAVDESFDFSGGITLRNSSSLPTPMANRFSMSTTSCNAPTTPESLSPQEDCSSGSDGGTHEILPLLPVGQGLPENWVHSFRVAGKAMFKCKWPDCPRGIFRQAEKALDHVCGHIQIKQYTCTCGKIFVSSSTAKRHVAMQVKVYPCQYCPKKFARKDYLKVHESRCATNQRYPRQ